MASAWGMVRGKPSNRKPLAQSAWAMRSLTRPMMMSSLTRPPESMTFLAARPSSVPALTAARNMSPVEIWGMPNFWQRNAACVPLPAPGAPNRMSLMVVLGVRMVPGMSPGYNCGRIACHPPDPSMGMSQHRGVKVTSQQFDTSLEKGPRHAPDRPQSAPSRRRTRARSSGVSTPAPGACVARWTAMRSPCHRTRSCSSDSTVSNGLTASCGNRRRKPAR